MTKRVDPDMLGRMAGAVNQDVMDDLERTPNTFVRLLKQFSESCIELYQRLTN